MQQKEKIKIKMLGSTWIKHQRRSSVLVSKDSSSVLQAQFA